MRSEQVIKLGCLLAIGFAWSTVLDVARAVRPELGEPVPIADEAAGFPGGLALKPPSKSGLLIDLPVYSEPALDTRGLRLFAHYYTTHVYQHPSQGASTLGLVRRGTLLKARKAISGSGCPNGRWYALADQGYACMSRGFSARAPAASDLSPLRPDVERSLPFRYGKINSRAALRFRHLPSEAELAAVEAAIAKGKRLPRVVVDELDGDYFVAIDREVSAGDRRYFRTVKGRYVRVEEVDMRPEPAMHGQLLRGEVQLPLAFVFGAKAVPLLKQHHGEMVVQGKAYKHARFPAVGTTSWGDKQVVLSPSGFAVERAHVRIARQRERPKGVAEGAKWIHVDVDQQTLVAYEGDRPVFATLVSAGKDGHDTPTGLYRIHEKHKTRTMRGSDPSGPFEVAEVPWTMFYRGSYALHGAYWHDDFGKVRSHGCTNLAPIDARWLFRFTEGDLPDGWHALRKLHSTQVYFTREG